MKASLESRIARLEVDRPTTLGIAERMSEARSRLRRMTAQERQAERDARTRWALESPPPARGLRLAMWKAARRLARLDGRSRSDAAADAAVTSAAAPANQTDRSHNHE